MGDPQDSTDDVGTRITLSGMRSEYAEHVPKVPINLAREFVSHFLPILLSNRQVEIIIDDEDEFHLAKLVRGELLIDKGQADFAVGSRTFSLLSVKLRPKQINLHHRIILAASSRAVNDHNLEKFIPVLPPGPLELEGEPDGFFSISIVEGEYLDQVVDPMRVTFTDEDDDQPDQDETETHDEPVIGSA